MPQPDINDYAAVEHWMADWHQWWRQEAIRPTLDDLAARAEISPEHLHNLLTGRRPLLAAHVQPIAAALGLNRGRTTRLRQMVCGELVTEPEPPLDDPRRAALLACLEEAREVLQASPRRRWTASASYWALTEAQAFEVFQAGRLAVAANAGAGRALRVCMMAVRVTEWMSATAPGESAEVEKCSLTRTTPPSRESRKMNAARENPALIDVLDFLDYREFINQFIDERCRLNRRLSKSGFARRLGVTPGHLGNILAGRRGLQPQLAADNGVHLHLDEERSRYIAALIRFNDAQDEHDALNAWTECNEIRARHGRAPEVGVGSPLYTYWYVPVVLELSTLQGWRPDPVWIAGILRPAISVAEAEGALQILRAAGFLGAQAAARAEAPEIRSAAWIGRALAVRFYDASLATASSRIRHDAETIYQLTWDTAQAADEPMSDQWAVQLWRDAVVKAAKADAEAAAEQTSPELEVPGRAIYLFYAQTWPAGPLAAPP